MFTNKTENLDLPQWVGTDKANWDIDLNYAFKQISDYVTTLNEKFSNINYTENDIKNDIQTINNNISSINTVLDSLNEVTTGHSSEISSLKEKVTKLQSDVSSLTTDFSESSADLTQRIQTIENDLPPIEQSITTLTQNYNALAEKVENSATRVSISSELNFTSSTGTTSSSIDFSFPIPPHLSGELSDMMLSVSLSPSGLNSIAENLDSSIKGVGLIAFSDLSENDLLLSITGIKVASYTGNATVRLKSCSTSHLQITVNYSLQDAIKSFRGVPSINVKVIKLR